MWRFPIAHDSQIFVTRLETIGPNAMPQVAYAGALPLKWKHGEFFSQLRTVGPEADADVLFVLENGTLVLTPLFIPTNFQAQHQGVTRLWLTLQARSNEGDSDPIRLEISWDGTWHPGETEMSQRLQISLAESPGSA